MAKYRINYVSIKKKKKKMEKEKLIKLFIEQCKKGKQLREDGCKIIKNQPPRGTQDQSALPKV